MNLQIIKLLSDGHFHSGETIGQQLGVSRTAIWKLMRNTQDEYGVEIQSVKGRGYRLARPVELLNEQRVRKNLAEDIRPAISKIDILDQVDSTNRFLLAAISQGCQSGHLVLAERQTAGRGRQGRTWVSPFGANVYCSFLWKFNLAASELAGLGIVTAIALVKALSIYDHGFQIKWPNDIFWQGKKLAGVLLELQGESNGPASVVIGLGVNVNMPVSSGANIDQAWTDMHRATAQPVSRNELVAHIMNSLISSIQQFEQQGLAPFVDTWPEWDMLYNQPVDIILASNTTTGIARGISQSGALCVDVDGQVKNYMAGEASIRK